MNYNARGSVRRDSYPPKSGNYPEPRNSLPPSKFTSTDDEKFQHFTRRPIGNEVINYSQIEESWNSFIKSSSTSSDTQQQLAKSFLKFFEATLENAESMKRQRTNNDAQLVTSFSKPFERTLENTDYMRRPRSNIDTQQESSTSFSKLFEKTLEDAGYMTRPSANYDTQQKLVKHFGKSLGHADYMRRPLTNYDTQQQPAERSSKYLKRTSKNVDYERRPQTNNYLVQELQTNSYMMQEPQANRYKMEELLYNSRRSSEEPWMRANTSVSSIPSGSSYKEEDLYDPASPTDLASRRSNDIQEPSCFSDDIEDSWEEFIKKSTRQDDEQEQPEKESPKRFIIPLKNATYMRRPVMDDDERQQRAKTWKRTWKDANLEDTSNSAEPSNKDEEAYVQDPTLPKDLLSLFQPLYCKLCIVQINSNVVAKQHYTSKNHEKKVRKWLTEYSAETGEPLHERAVVPQLKKEDILQECDPKYFYCDVCTLPLTGKIHAESHYLGKSHQRAVSKKKTTGKGFYNEEGEWINIEEETERPDGSSEISKSREQIKKSLKSGDAVIAKATKNPLKCDLCVVACTNKEQMDVHLQGKRHKKKVIEVYCTNFGFSYEKAQSLLC